MVSSDKHLFERISIKDGLPNTSVTCIIQDSDGFMWFGTFNGVCKYDGYRFKNYTFFTYPINVLDSNVTSIYEDSDKKLWLGTANGFLLEYDKNSDLFLKHKLNIPDKCFINSISEDRFGFLWISSFEKGLFKFDKKTKDSYRINFKKDQDFINKSSDINVILMKDNDELIIGTTKNGIYLFNVLDGSCDNYCLKLIGENTNTFIKSIHKYNDQNYLILTSSNLILFNVVSKEFKDIVLDKLVERKASTFSKSIYFNEKLYVSLSKYGLLEIDFNSKEIFKLSGSFGKDRIISIYIDKSQVIWMGTMGSGLFKLNSIRKKFYHANKLFDSQKEFNMVFELKIDKNDNLWIGSFEYGLFKSRLVKEKPNNKINLEEHFLDNYSIGNIFEDSENNLWIGSSSKGLFKYIKETNYFDQWKCLIESGYNRIFAISEYIKGTDHFLLLGTNKNGLLCLNIKTNSIHEFTDIYMSESKIKNDTVSKLYLDSKNNLWLAISNFTGTFKISLDDYTKKNYYPFELGKIYEDRNNNIWIGSSSGLIKHECESGLIYCYNKEQGLSHDKIYGVLEDKKGNIWVSTRETISRFDISLQTFRNYEYKNGPLNEEFWISCCQDKEGTLYFGGVNGIDYFNPDEIIDNHYIPNIAITDFQLFNESVSPSQNNPFLNKNITFTDKINLTYKENIFSLEFAALSFNNPQKNLYAYKMEGFDKDWVYCGTRRTASYTNLNPGEYIFKVKGSNNDGIWNEEGTSIKITISPPYWKTWWFKGLGALTMVAVTGYSYKKRLEKYEKESKVQEDFSRKLIETQENEKKRIAHELHDTIAHEVLISKNKALMALKHKDDNDKLVKTMEEISELSTSTITDVRNIAYNLHPHQLEKLGITKTIGSIINEVSKSTDINFIYETDNIDEVLSKESEINLFRVIQEIISNIIKHSKASEVILKVSRTEKELWILIVDNGRGFDIHSKAFDEAKSGFGLSGITERIKFMSGELKIDSEINKGTTLKFKIPILKI